MKKKSAGLLLYVFLLTVTLFFLAAQKTGPGDVAPAVDQSKKITQLEKRLPVVQGKEKINVLLALAKEYLHTDANKVLAYANQALILCRETNNLKAEAEALGYLCTGHLSAANYGKALVYGEKCIKISKKTGDKKLTIEILGFISIALYHLGNFEEALENRLEALKISEETGDSNLIALAKANIGTFYSSLFRYPEALKYYTEALEMFKKLGNTLRTAQMYSNMATVYADLKDNQKALKYYFAALEINEEIGDKEGIVFCLYDIGLVYQDSKDYMQALSYYLKAVKLNEETGSKRKMTSLYRNIGSIYFFLEKYDKAVEYRTKALKFSEELGSQSEVADSLWKLGDLYTRLKKYDKAQKCLEQGLQIALEINAKDLQSAIYAYTSDLYAAIKDYKKAFQFQVNYHRTDTAMLREKTGKQINQLQIRFDTEKKEREIELLEKDKKVRALTLSNTKMIRTGFIGGFILVSIILALLFKRYLYLFAFWKKQEYFGRFRLLEKIGSGAMGTVYKAHQIADKSEIAAVKILKEEFFNDEYNKKRFKQEAVIIDKLEHPHIVKIIERGDYNRQLFTAMEFLPGQTLEDKINKEKQLTIKESLHIMVQISGAVLFIHNNNIVHRDLKPDNVMLVQKDGDPDFVKLLDFGLARMEFQTRLTQSGNFIGTIAYMAPEQVLHAHTSPANDIFSMGVIFYRMLGGQSPFQGETAIEIMGQIINKEPFDVTVFNMEIPAELNLLVMAMIDKDPGKRPSAETVHNRLIHLSHMNHI